MGWVTTDSMNVIGYTGSLVLPTIWLPLQSDLVSQSDIKNYVCILCVSVVSLIYAVYNEDIRRIYNIVAYRNVWKSR